MSLNVEKCLQAWTNSLRQMKAKADVVFFGDSLTYYGDFASVFPERTVCNLGLRGDTLSGMIKRVEQLMILHPKRVFLMAGINDVSALSLPDFKKMYLLLVQTILRELPETELLLQSILPVNSLIFSISCDNEQISSCNHIIEGIANSKQLQYLDIYPYYINDGQLLVQDTLDGLHLKREAYSKWYDVIKKYLR